MTMQRRRSNELAASTRILQLRALQSQLSTMITSNNNDDIDDDSSDSLNSLDYSTRSTRSHGPTSLSAMISDIDASTRTCPARQRDYSLKYDVEAGMRFAPSSKLSSSSYEIVEKRRSENDAVSSATPLYRMSSGEQRSYKACNNLSQPSTLTIPNASSTDDVSFMESDNATAKQSESENTTSTADDAPATAETSVTPTRGRSFVMKRSSSFSRSLSGRRSSMFKSSKKKESANHISNKQAVLPSYDFLEEESKEQSSLFPNAKWWHGVFFFSIISLLACIITLWAPYPIGARMPSDQIASMPWSNGCQGIDSCICPRETICADDMLSMIFLTIARSSAWFNYPLYMLLFMSKANNLNHFLQKTALRCWINFSDYHKVHSLFGIVVGIESTSHSFFHILRWARRNNDIQLLWTHRTGITGLTALLVTPLIVLPMTVPFLKKMMTYEFRKGECKCRRCTLTSYFCVPQLKF